MKTLKICLVILCLLSFRTVGLPQSDGANFFMKEIKLTQGKFALVDDEDFDFLNQWKWCAHYNQGSRTFYVQRSERKEHVRVCYHMHRVIMKTPDNLFVDHSDGNGLNNQKSNLRNCDKFGNTKNKRKHKVGSSKFKGVSWDSWHNKWKCRVTNNKKVIQLGRYDSELEAAKVYNEAALKYHGEFANLNIIE